MEQSGIEHSKYALYSIKSLVHPEWFIWLLYFPGEIPALPERYTHFNICTRQYTRTHSTHRVLFLAPAISSPQNERKSEDSQAFVFSSIFFRLHLVCGVRVVANTQTNIHTFMNKMRSEGEIKKRIFCVIKYWRFFRLRTSAFCRSQL